MPPGIINSSYVLSETKPVAGSIFTYNLLAIQFNVGSNLQNITADLNSSSAITALGNFSGTVYTPSTSASSVQTTASGSASFWQGAVPLLITVTGTTVYDYFYFGSIVVQGNGFLYTIDPSVDSKSTAETTLMLKLYRIHMLDLLSALLLAPLAIQASRIS